MRLPAHVFDTLVEVCEAYPYRTVQDAYHLGEILNAVAYRHRDEGWGLSRKTGGTRVPSPVGEIAEDILQLPNGHHFDVLGSAKVGNPLLPGRPDSIGIIDLAARPWVAPVLHVPSWMQREPPTQAPTPTPTPAPTVCACAADLSVLRAQMQTALDRLDVILHREAADAGQQRGVYDLIASEVIPHIDDVKRLVAGVPRDPRFL